MAAATEFKVSERDYVAACKAACRKQLSRIKTWRRLVMLAVLAGGVVAVLGYYATGDWIGAVTVAALGATVGFAAGAGCVGVTYLLLPRRAGRLYRQQRQLHHAQTVEWDQTQLRWSSPGLEMRTAWKEYYGWAETRDMFLLYVNEQMPNFIPKARLTTDLADDLRATLVAHGPPRR